MNFLNFFIKILRHYFLQPLKSLTNTLNRNIAHNFPDTEIKRLNGIINTYYVKKYQKTPQLQNFYIRPSFQIYDILEGFENTTKVISKHDFNFKGRAHRAVKQRRKMRITSALKYYIIW